MSEHKAMVRWTQSGGGFLDGKYSREHTWTFDGGVVVPASPSSWAVPPPYSNEANVDPEEAFVAAVSSCHMLTFLHVASRQGIEVISYEDEAVGSMTKNDAGRWWMSSVVLKPRIAYTAETSPSREAEQRLHHAAHTECYIANSVKTDVTVLVDEA
jgi:organic hydroperoxide reductase OsmC/OhrA